LIGKQLILQINDCRLVFAMLNAIVISIRFILLILAGQKQVALENAALRQQLAVFKRNVPRPKVNNRDRLFWIGLYMIWQGWQSALIFVQPETVTSWHHHRFKRYWWKLSQSKQPGRPRTGAEIRKLIHTMATANPTWGAPRIHGELKKLGFTISERTVSRWMPKKTGKPSQTWMTFLRNHVGQMVSIDFFTVPTLQLRVLYVFVVLAHDRRRVLHFNVTEHPTAAWTAQQLVEAFPYDSVPRYLVRDRDGIYGYDFTTRVDGMGIRQVPISARSPWQNCYTERMIGSIRRECLNHVIVINEWHLRRILKSYFSYYHRSRTHLSLDKDAPESRPVQDLQAGRIIQIREVGGLHHRYERRAA
jgi:putative transposase